MKFSVIILTYNPTWEKLQLTIDSTLCQTLDDYEIVIADDGSEDNLSEKIVDYFAKKDFSRYKLITHEKNQGTVKNLIDAVSACDGIYIRDFGTGDLFYNEYTLENIYNFLVQGNYEGCFGLMKTFHLDNKNHIVLGDFYHPFDINAYKRKDLNRITKNLVLYHDNASGACTCYTKDYYLHYLKSMEDIVIYSEDIFQLMSGLDQRPLAFYPDYMIWYEINAGVSTQKHSKFAKLLALDVDRYYELLHKQYAENRYIKKHSKVMGLYKIENLYLRTILRFFINPDSIRYLVSHFFQTKSHAYRPLHHEIGFLSENNPSKWSIT